MKNALAPFVPELTVSELDQMAEAEPISVPERLLRLGTLVEHIDSQALQVHPAFRVSIASLLRVTTFADREGHGFFASVDDAGLVTVGSTDEERAPASESLALRHLDGFERANDEVISLCFSRYGRFTGRKTDLWAVVRHWENGQPSILAYHALVFAGPDGRPRLEPARDDCDTEQPAQLWQASQIVDLPRTVVEHNLTAGLGDDPLDPQAGQPPAPAPGRAFVVVSPGVCMWPYPEDTLNIHAATWEKPLQWQLSSRDRLRAATLQRVPAGPALGPPATTPLRVVVCDDVSAVALDVSPGGTAAEAWRCLFDTPPRAAAFVAGRCPSEAWPDLLVAHRDGTITRWRNTGSKPAEAWKRTWDGWTDLPLGFSEKLAFFETLLINGLARPSPQDPDLEKALQFSRVREAIFRHMAEALLLERADCPVEAEWTNRVASLISSSDSNRSSWPTIDYLLGLLESWLHRSAARSETADPVQVTTVPGSSHPGRLLRLLRQAYRRPASLLLQERVDIVIRRLALLYPQHRAFSDFEDLRELKTLAFQTTDKVWTSLSGDESRTDELIRQAAMAMTRYTSRLERIDAFQASDVALASAHHATHLENGGVRWLILASSHTVGALPWNDDGTVDENLLQPTKLGAQRRLVAMRPMRLRQGGYLLLAFEDGKLELGQVSEQGFRVVERVHDAGLRPGERLSALDLLELDSDTWLAALGISTARGGWIVRVLSQHGTAKEHERLSLNSPVSALHLARTGLGSGILLLAGTGADPRGVLWEMGEPFSPPISEIRRDFDARIQAARSDDKNRPKVVAIGDRAGFVWGIDLTLGLDPLNCVRRLRWCFRIAGGVTSVNPIPVDGDSCFLAGSGGGRVVLLERDTGSRLWMDQFGPGVRALTTAARADGAVLAAAAVAGGRVVTLRSLTASEREDAHGVFKDLVKREALRSWARETEQPLARADHEAVWAVMGLVQEGSPAASILSRLQHRTAREQFLTYLAGPGCTRSMTPGERLALVRGMTYRDLGVFQASLDSRDHSWNVPIDSRLAADAREPEGLSAGDSGLGARMQAQAIRLQRLAYDDGITMEQAMSHRPPDADLEEDWVAFELARLLLHAASREEKNENRLLEKLMTCLLQLPPRQMTAWGRVAGGYFCWELLLSAIGRIVSALDRSEPPNREALAAVERLLRPWKDVRSENPNGVLGLLRAMAVLLRLPRPETENTGDSFVSDWSEQRRKLLEPIRDLAPWFQQAPASRDAYGHLWNGVRGLVPEDRPAPADNVPLSLRISWLHQALQRTEAMVKPVHVPSRSWEDFALALARDAAKVARWAYRAELRYCQTITRPHLRLLRWEPSSSGDHAVVLRMTSDGRPLEHVTVEVRAASESGFLETPGANRSWRQTFASFHRVETDVRLAGRLRPGQLTLGIAAELNASASAYIEDWSFRAPTPQPESTRPFPSGMPKTFEKLCRSVLEKDSGTAVVALDDDIGSEAFISSAVERFAAQRLEADDLLARRYTRITAEEVDSWLEERLKGTTRAFVVASGTGQLGCIGEREPNDALRALLAPKRGNRRLIIVVPTRVARAITRAAAGIELHLPHLLDPAGLEEAWEWIQASSSPRPSEKVRLGNDLRLLARWFRVRRTAGENSAAPDPIPEFLESPDTRRFLLKEIQELTPLEALTLMAGAVTSVQLSLAQMQEGMWPRDDIQSTAEKHRSKTVLRKGEAITASSLNDLRSDRQPPSHVWVEGCGPSGSSQTDYGSRLGGAFAHIPGIDWAFKAVRPHMGKQIGAVFHTVEPYRSLIRRQYSHATLGGHSVDGTVLREIYGPEMPLAYALGMEALPRIPSEQLTGILSLPQRDVRTLRRLAEAWAERSKEDVLPLLRSLFGLRRSDLRPPDEDGSPGAELLSRGTSGDVRIFVCGTVREGVSDEFVVWAESDSDVQGLGARLDRLQIEREAGKREPGTPLPPLRAVVLGPGAFRARGKSDRVVVLDEREICLAASEGDLAEGIARRERSQIPRSVLSPFSSTGALPAGSPAFVGREREIEFVRQRIRQHSILIAGPRRIGKTSLLNQLAAWARKEPDLLTIEVDLQGYSSERDVLRLLGSKARQHPTVPQSAFASVEDVVSWCESYRKLAVFFLNEIDELLSRDGGFFRRLRGLNDEGRARFVMVGYSSLLSELADPKSPFFHFSQGPDPGDPSLTIRELDERAGWMLIRRLEEEPLKLRWSPSATEAGPSLLLERSYRIPWLLQSLCQALVVRLDERHTDEIGLADVEAVTADTSDVVWRELERIDLAEVVPWAFHPARPAGKRMRHGGEHTSSPAPVSAGLRAGISLILVAVARDRYILRQRGAPSIADRRLLQMSPTDTHLAFTAGEAREIVLETVEDLLLPGERGAVRDWFKRLDLYAVLRALTVTLFLEPDPRDPSRFGFLRHIYPRELWRRIGAADPLFDSNITAQAREFWTQISTLGVPNKKED